MASLDFCSRHWLSSCSTESLRTQILGDCLAKYVLEAIQRVCAAVVAAAAESL